MLLFGFLLPYNSISCDIPNCKICEEKAKVASLNIQKMPCEQYAELKEKIISVQNENDKRFSVFLWAFTIIITLLVASVGYTLYRNPKLVKETAQETAKKEFIKEYKIFKRKFFEVLRDTKAEKEKIETLKFEFEQYYAMIKEAKIVSSEIEVKDSDKDKKK